MKVKLVDKLGLDAGEVDIPKIVTILIWGDAVYLASGDHYAEVSYHVVPDTPETRIYKLP